MYKIHCLNPIASAGLALLTDAYELTGDIMQADAVLVRSADMHKLEVPETLKAVARAGAGVNNIPLQAYADKNIAVFNTPGANANAVKELVICALILAARDVAGGIAWCNNNACDPQIAKSAEKAKKQFAGGEITSKTLGVIGLGAIGKLVAQAANALGMRIVGYDPFVSAEAAAEIVADMTYVADIKDLYVQADYVTIHVPAIADTIGMLNTEAFACMKPGVAILNFSRATLVNDEDMHTALESGLVRIYITDFANPAVMQMPNTVVIPHLGASTAEAEENCAKMAVRELMEYLETGKKTHCVNETL